MCVKISRELLSRFQNADDNIIRDDSTLLNPRFKKYGFKKESANKNAYDRIVIKIIHSFHENGEKN